MPSDSAQFVFMTCRPGAETALKQEVAGSDPMWRLAFSRPAFVTFKFADGQPLDESQLAARHWIFARTHGISLGRITGTQIGEMAPKVWQLPSVAAHAADESFADVHVWQRGAQFSDDSEIPNSVTPLAEEIEAALRTAAPANCAKIKISTRWKGPRGASIRDSRVLDLVVVEPNQWWIGSHLAVTQPQRWPGGVITIQVPEHAVSRAYAKMEEALTWSGLPLVAGEECAEIGCAPGGASQALLDRGLFVTGIDPAEVDPAVLAHPRFRHLRKRGKEVRRSEFVGVRWLAVDVNLAPNYTLDAVEAIVNHPGVSIRGLVLTLKLADWSLAEQLPELAARVRGWGFRDVRLRQLATGGQEVCLAALRRRELRRLGRKRKSQTASEPRGKDAAAERAAAAVILRVDPPQTALSGPHI
jgi:23S rRNA (cytidine2498-2'-O)-methyltransferase